MKRNLKRKVLLISCLLLAIMGCRHATEAQQLPSLKVSVLCQGFGHSLSGVPNPSLSYGLRVGTEWSYFTKGIFSVGQDVNLGWYVHKRMQNSLMVSTAPTIRLATKGGFEAYFSLGAGKAVNLMAQTGYKDNGDGTFTREHHAFYSPWLLTGSLGIGYNLGKRSNLNMAVFAETQTIAELVRNQYTPVFPHHLLHIGARIPFSSNF
ncbi:hypothetical protein [uncultured Imperialibacter sp.]|uniref:hypothetical protein n=1 Tax=uncultured Imperialibacter sp. TaxID=1672639 RepID=UPI0030DC2A38|tara:strand:+ start:142943 stop:143563 length:621 start_codon:yes stop_codon:yes gene_type:complete